MTHVAKAVPDFSILLSAGVNSQMLGNIAKDSQRIHQTKFLVRKYGLTPPAVLQPPAAEATEG